jgi:hypothetical protein
VPGDAAHMRSMRHARAQLPLIATIAAAAADHHAAIIFAHAQLPGASLTRSGTREERCPAVSRHAQTRY